MKKHLGLIALVVGALAISMTSQAANWPETKNYVAGSAGITVVGPGVSISEAGGAVDCATGAGGACFDTTGHKGIFNVSAIDMAGGSVGIFMGFDVDGDGCVACKNGSALGEDGDIFFQGADTVTGFIPDQLPNPTLFVFVRLATVNTVDPGTTGTLTIAGGCPDGGDRCQTDQDPNMGTICTRQGTPGTGGPDDGCQHIMYPYPGH